MGIYLKVFTITLAGAEIGSIPFLIHDRVCTTAYDISYDDVPTVIIG